MRRSDEVAAQSRSERDRGTDYETIKKGDKKEPPANLLKAMARGSSRASGTQPGIQDFRQFWILAPPLGPHPDFAGRKE